MMNSQSIHVKDLLPVLISLSVVTMAGLVGVVLS